MSIRCASLRYDLGWHTELKSALLTWETLVYKTTGMALPYKSTHYRCPTVKHCSNKSPDSIKHLDKPPHWCGVDMMHSRNRQIPKENLFGNLSASDADSRNMSGFLKEFGTRHCGSKTAVDD